MYLLCYVGMHVLQVSIRANVQVLKKSGHKLLLVETMMSAGCC